MHKELRVSILAAVASVGTLIALLGWADQRSVSAAVSETSTFVMAEVPLPIANAHAITTDEFMLSQSVSRNQEHGVELIRIDADGTTYIRATSTNKILSAQPGECFSSVEFGNSGLLLEFAFPSLQTAKFVRTQCFTQMLQ